MRKLRHYIFLSVLFYQGMGVSAGHTADIERVAVGVHPTFTRVVFHLNEATPFTQTLDETGQPSLVLSNVTTAGPVQSFTPNHAPLTGLTYHQDNAGLRITFATNRSVDVKSFSLTPDDYGGHRVVIDFPKQETLFQPVRQTPATLPEPKPVIAAAPLPPEPKPPLASPDISGPVEVDPCRQTQIMLNQNQWNMAALIEHGLCKKEAGRLEEAQNILERILTFDPEFHRARLALADVYARRGYSSKAREAYTYVLKTNPPSDVRSQIELRLSQLN